MAHEGKRHPISGSASFVWKDKPEAPQRINKAVLKGKPRRVNEEGRHEQPAGNFEA